jgi:hypothetical protein
MAWTDDPIVPDQTSVKGLHIDEVRERIDTLEETSCPLHDSSALSGDLGSHLTGDDGANFSTHNPDEDNDAHTTWYDTDLNIHYTGMYTGENTHEDLGDYTDVESANNTPVNSSYESNNLESHKGWYNYSVDNVEDTFNHTGELGTHESGYEYGYYSPDNSPVNTPYNAGEVRLGNTSVYTTKVIGNYGEVGCPALTSHTPSKNSPIIDLTSEEILITSGHSTVYDAFFSNRCDQEDIPDFDHADTNYEGAVNTMKGCLGNGWHPPII